MRRQFYEYATEVNIKLIVEVAKYYNDARKSIKFYSEVNSPILQNIVHGHKMHWKSVLRRLILQGINCQTKGVLDDSK